MRIGRGYDLAVRFESRQLGGGGEGTAPLTVIPGLHSKVLQHLTRKEGGKSTVTAVNREWVGCRLPLESKSNATACASDKVPDCVDPEEQCSQYLAGWAVQ
jgi:hypothetical protein